MPTTRPQAARPHRFVSLRVKLLVVVLGVALGPLVLLGAWIARSAERSGERLLRTRLDTALTRVASDLGSHWVRERSVLLTIAENPALRHALADARSTLSTIAISSTPGLANVVASDVQLAVVRDSSARARWTVITNGDSVLLRPFQGKDTVVDDGATDAGLQVTFDIAGDGPGRLGSLDVRLNGSVIVERGAASAVALGALLTAVTRDGSALAPLPFDSRLLKSGRFVWTGEEWLAASSELDEPPLTLVAAAPLTPFVAPFQRTARASSLTLAFVALGALLLTMFLTTRLTRALERLALAAKAVSRGNLDQRIEVTTGDEVGQLTEAFNLMTENLRQTLQQLSRTQAAAAVGQLASSIAHEVRNPLSVIRLRLQHAEEQVETGSPVGASLSRALHEVDRVERTIAGTLRIAQSGRIPLEPIDLRTPLEAACRVATTEFFNRRTQLQRCPIEPSPLRVLGNAAALEQVFVNILINAAQSSDGDGVVQLKVASTTTRFVVSVCDTGRGLDEAAIERVFEPFYTTKSDGTGLGLTIVKRIVDVHGGEVSIESTIGVGTSVHVILPRLVNA